MSDDEYLDDLRERMRKYQIAMDRAFKEGRAHEHMKAEYAYESLRREYDRVLAGTEYKMLHDYVTEMREAKEARKIRKQRRRRKE